MEDEEESKAVAEDKEATMRWWLRRIRPWRKRRNLTAVPQLICQKLNNSVPGGVWIQYGDTCHFRGDQRGCRGVVELVQYNEVDIN